MKATEHCELCGRHVPVLTRHHLIPRTRHANKRVRRLFTREEMQQNILWLCRPCHTHIHNIIDEKQMALHFHTRERLLQHPQIRRFVRWIAKKPAMFSIASRSWKH